MHNATNGVYNRFVLYLMIETVFSIAQDSEASFLTANRGNTFERLRDFRAGVEFNISELKRAFGMVKPPGKSMMGLPPTYGLVRGATI